MNNPCGCCDGIEAITPSPIQNRPGLSTLAYRVGTHATFLETMLARLSSSQYPELRGLKTRLEADPAIAFLDAWATVADVLTFYQERIANEGYLRTATERRSILELGRLVGYTLRPGVSSSVYLAYTMEKDHTLLLTPGNRAQSLPGPGELPQSFETAEPLMARSAWNNLKPRLTRPQTLTLDTAKQTINTDTLYLQGGSTNLKPNDPLLFVAGEGTNQQVLRRIEQVEVQASANRTKVTLQKVVQPSAPSTPAVRLQAESTPNDPSRAINAPAPDTAVPIQSETLSRAAFERLNRFIQPLAKARSVPPQNALRLERKLDEIFAPDADTHPQLLAALQPALRPGLYQAWQSLAVEPSTRPVTVYALRTRASVFGHNAPDPPIEQSPASGGGSTRLERVTPHSTVPAPEPFNITVVLSPQLAATTPDASTSAGTPANGAWTIATAVTFGDQAAPQIQDSRPLPLPNQDPQSFQIGQAETDIINITVLRQGGGLSPFRLTFTFTNRPIVVEMGVDAHNQFQVSRAGANPTSVTIGGANIQPSRNQVGMTLTMTVNGEVTRQLSPTATTLQAVAAQSQSDPLSAEMPRAEMEHVLWLDAPYGHILPNSWVVIERSTSMMDEQGQETAQTIITQAQSVSDRSRKAYVIAIKATRLDLKQDWLNLRQDTFQVIRETAVLAQSELLALAEEPMTQTPDPQAPVIVTEQPIAGSEIELAELYGDLEAGRWIIVAGERVDVPGGVKASELVMLAGVKQSANPALQGDTTHTFLELAKPLAYQYKRDTVTVYGNVVKATHGETRTEVLGSGNASQPFPAFALKQSPVTYLAAPTPAGAASTLAVRVNDLLWHETDSLATVGATDRAFITQTNDAGQTTVIFGNGQQGARPASGTENITATYRTGIGNAGNVKADQISLLATRPLGVKSVTNPLSATGGADAENRDQARRNVPLALMALDRLVSVQDYADFARTYAGIGKATAASLSDGQRQLVHLTIATTDDSPIDQTSDLYRNFLQALRQYGDPSLPIQVDVRELILLVINANIQILPDYRWEPVVTAVRSALLQSLSFEQRNLGQSVYRSEVIRTMQQVPGVAYVDVDTFGGVPEKQFDARSKQRRVLTPTEIITQIQTLIADSRKNGPADVVPVALAGNDGGLHPAQIAYLTPAIADTLILNQIKP